MSSKNTIKKIGILGGTFDPPHIGHLVIAEQARQQLHLDEILLIPAYQPPHKRIGTGASPSQRLDMIRRAIRGLKGFRVDSIEVRRKGVSYTIETLRYLRKEYPGMRFYMIAGEDNYAQMATWKSINEILTMVTVVVYRRRGDTSQRREKNRIKALVLHGPMLDLSSTMIRHKVGNNQSIRFLVPFVVEKYIKKTRLYQSITK
jgi:nicotinate-nucleotide adenylyltransferase